MPTVHTIPGDAVLEGKYHIECRLGQGGMGVVYKARHAYLKTQLAIKVILPDLVGNDPQLVTRFRQEALAAAAIRHQNVVSVTDYGVIDGTVPFLVMEYVEGESLHEMLAREGRFSPEKAYEVMAAICSGVGAAHHQGIVHRDLKPLNIMICKDKPNMGQSVKILDFGLAKIKSGELLGSFVQAQTTGLMGSPYYMAPEQWADEEPDMRADVYSLGVMFFQMLAGDVPFKGASIPAIMKKHISDAPPSFADANVPVSPELERAVHHTLQKDASKRTPTVDAFVSELAAAIYPGVTSIHTSTAPPLPVSSLKILSRPPKSSVFVDNVSVGQTHENGVLLLEGVRSGNHRLRVTHEGLPEWQAEVVCDGRPQEIVADLQAPAFDERTAVLSPEAVSRAQRTIGAERPAPVTQFAIEQTVQRQTGSSTAVQQEKRGLAGLLWGIGGVFTLFIIVALGLGTAYMLGIFGPAKPPPNANVNVNTSPTPGTVNLNIKPELLEIPGGKLRMGRNAGPEDERPEHVVTVKSLRMDKTEVANEEYAAFLAQSGYRPVPSGWSSDGRPPEGQEKYPVRFVNMDDVNAFIAWRSKRDGVTYRLPTEEEWEYAARNGAKGNLYPWGNNPQQECAVLGKAIVDTSRVGVNSCPNDWGVYDLIGNVFEWTSTPIAPYPGSRIELADKELKNVVRGGCANNTFDGPKAITATSRLGVPPSKRDGQLGFRLVRDE